MTFPLNENDCSGGKHKITTKAAELNKVTRADAKDTPGQHRESQNSRNFDMPRPAVIQEQGELTEDEKEGLAEADEVEHEGQRIELPEINQKRTPDEDI